MNIKLYPVKIEAVDEDDPVSTEPLFVLSAFDESTATLQMNALLCDENVDELLRSVKAGLIAMGLK